MVGVIKGARHLMLALQLFLVIFITLVIIILVV